MTNEKDFLDKASLLSQHGRCKTFDCDAQGYVRSEGCGVIVLKRLDDALANKYILIYLFTF